jgi:hypothetical protein
MIRTLLNYVFNRFNLRHAALRSADHLVLCRTAPIRFEAKFSAMRTPGLEAARLPGEQKRNELPMVVRWNQTP